MTLSAPSEQAPDLQELSSLRTHLMRLSSHDQDTGLLNCEALLAAINTEIAKARPRPLGATLIEIRIRGLSRIGEVYGRKAIGSVIRQLAERLAGFHAVVAMSATLEPMKRSQNCHLPSFSFSIRPNIFGHQ